MIVTERRNNRRTHRRLTRQRHEAVWVALPDTHKQDHQKSTVAEPTTHQRRGEQIECEVLLTFENEKTLILAKQQAAYGA